MKSVSVIIPAYNAAIFLRQAIESVLAQTYRNFEIIVVDDGSTDETPQIVQGFGDPVRCIHQSNQGLSGARNTGIQNSQAEIIALLDADDLWEPQFLEIMMGMLEQNPEAVGAYSGFQYIDAQGCTVGKPSLMVASPEEFYRTLIYSGNWLVPSAVVFRKYYAEKVGLFDKEIGPVADTDLWTKLSRQGSMVGISQALVRYRRHDANMSKDPEQMVLAGYKRVQKVFGPEVGDISSWNGEKVAAYRNHFRSAAIRYLGSGNAKKSAWYLQKLSAISPDYFFSLGLWRKLVRAHIPDEFQFDTSFRLDWTKAVADIEMVLTELSKLDSKVARPTFWYSKLKSSAFLALADEAGRSAELLRALSWIWKALFYNPQLALSRPYWGTVVRSVSSKLSR